MSDRDTIAAISTPFGTGAIAIVRMSGSRAFEIAQRVFKGRRSFDAIKSHVASYGKIVDPSSGETVDEVMLIKMKGPGTFTGEDVAEINCHGGIVLQRRVLELLITQGARPAEPGEFSKRAFLNGKMDLSQAEAVIDMINSKTILGSRTAAKQLEGRLSEMLNKARRRLIDLLAHIDATVDYPEHDLEEATGEMVSAELRKIRTNLETLYNQFEKGRIIREGISVVITGRPNTGKSSLLNRLSGRNRAIVTDIPGTTRDLLEEYISIKGIPVRAVDTAGIRHTEDTVERLGVEKAMAELESADLVILMLDASADLNVDEIKLLQELEGRKHIVLVNKIDVASRDYVVEDVLKKIESQKAKNMRIIMTSIVNDIGIDLLEDAIAEMFLGGETGDGADILLTNARHKDLVGKALSGIDQALSAYEEGMPLDIMSIEIGEAAQSIGAITGEDVSESVIEEIFSRFCVGK